MTTPPERGPEQDRPDYAFGRLFGRAPRPGGRQGSSARLLSTLYTFVLVWFSTALIMVFGTRLLGLGRGAVEVALICLVVSLVAAIALTAWVRRRR